MPESALEQFFGVISMEIGRMWWIFLLSVVLVGVIKRLADVVIEPSVGDVHWADFSAVDQCIQAGDDATTHAVKQARDLLRRERLASLVRQRTGKRRAGPLHVFQTRAPQASAAQVGIHKLSAFEVGGVEAYTQEIRLAQVGVDQRHAAQAGPR